MTTESFSSLPQKIYNEAVDEILKLNKLDDKTKFKVEYSAGSAKGDNYSGAVYRIQVKDKKDDSVKKSLVVKVQLPNEFLLDDMFTREIWFYDILMPMFKKFQEEKGVNIATEGFNEAPQMYWTLPDPPNQAMFLDDLKFKGFQMYDRMKDITKDYVILVMKALAKMHALFFCLKDQHPDQIKQFIGMEDSFLTIVNQGKVFLNLMYESQKKNAYKVLENVQNADMKMKIDNFLKRDMIELLKELIGTNIAEPYSTVCHGDVWNNNMMFKVSEDGIPEKVNLLDFQILRYASPAIDVVHYIFTSTTKELRNKHYQEFLNVYYDTLSSFIKRLNSDPEKLFPRHIFDEHLKRFGKFGLYMAILILSGVTSSSEDAPDLHAIAEVAESNQNKDIETFKASERSEKRLMGVFEDIYRLGYV